MTPHPAKVAKGGEDAFSISDDNRLLTVADGVGGWANHGVDPSKYSRELCNQIKQHYQRDEKRVKYRGLPKDILVDAASQVNELGTCTVAIAQLDHNVNIVSTANFGDSGYLWLRKQGIDLIVQHESKPMQHSFNYPF